MKKEHLMMRTIISAAMLGLLVVMPAASAEDHAAHHGQTGKGQTGMAQTGMAAMEIKISIADGAVLSTRPARIDLTFAPAMRLASARLTTATGEIVPVRFNATAPAVTTATVEFAPLSPDSYTFTFTADAGDHTMPGRVRFTVR